MDGWIKLHRKIRDWEWYKDGNTMRVFIELLLRASISEKEYRKVELKRGQCVFGLTELSKSLGLTPSQTRTSLNHLQNSKQIAIKTTNKFSVATIVKYSDFQDRLDENRKQNSTQIANKIANKSHATSQQNKKKEYKKKEDKNNSTYTETEFFCPVCKEKIQRKQCENENGKYILYGHKNFRSGNCRAVFYDSSDLLRQEDVIEPTEEAIENLRRMREKWTQMN